MSRVFSGASGVYMSYSGTMGITADPVSILAWVKLATLDSGMICSYENTGSNYVALNTLAGAMRTLIQQEFGGNASTVGTATVDTWIPVIGIYLGTTIAEIDALGESVEGGFCGGFQAEASPLFSIGTLVQNTGLNTLNGKVAHVAMWSSELSGAEIAELVAGADPATVAAASLIEHWPLTDASLVGVNGRTLTITGSVTSDAADNPAVGAAGPAITSTSDDTPTDGSTLTITGTNFGAVEGTVTANGVAWVVTSWADTSIQVTVDIGDEFYGVNVPLIVIDDNAVSSAAHNVQIQPAAGTKYINLVAPLADPADRFETTPDLQGGWQIAVYDVQGGTIDDITLCLAMVRQRWRSGLLRAC